MDTQTQSGPAGGVAPPAGGIDGIASVFAQRRQAGAEARAQAVAGGTPESPPVEQQATTPRLPVDDSAGNAEQPASLTGQETAEQLRERGIESPRAHDRIAELGQQKNQAQLRAELAEARLAEMTARLDSLETRVGRPGIEPEEPVSIPPRAFPEQHPGEDASYEKIEAWEQRKREYEVGSLAARHELSDFVPQLGKLLQPLMDAHAKTERESAWAKVTPAIEQLGVRRDEIEPTVMEMIRQNPNLSLEAAAYNAITFNGISVADRVRKTQATPPAGSIPPSVSVPGDGRLAPRPAPQGSGQRGQDDALARLKQIADTSVGTGDDGMRNYFAALRQAGMIRQPHPEF